MTEEHKLLEQQWLALRDSIIPAGTAPIQMDTARRLFYVGAIALVRLVQTAADAEQLYQELEAFKKEQSELPDPYVRTAQ